MRVAIPLCLACLAIPAAAFAQPSSVQPPSVQATTPMLLALRAQAWPVAEALAAAEPDRLAGELVAFIRLLHEGSASAGELQAFIAAHPDWPDRPALEHRYAEALAALADDRAVAALCSATRPLPEALPRCAEALSLTGQQPLAETDARRAWAAAALDAAAEPAFLARWARVLTAGDQAQRFELLLATDAKGAQRQIGRLDPTRRAWAAARLALRRGAADALATLEAIPAAQRDDPALLLAEARALRRSGGGEAALALWRTALPAAEAAVSVDRRTAFWTERDALARQLLAAGDAKTAYAVADDPGVSQDARRESLFLTGWIALRRLHDAPSAQRAFAALADGAHSAITRSRAAYWRAQAAPGPAAAKAALGEAGAFPTTYYGQLALRALGESDAAIAVRIASLRDPQVDSGRLEALAGSEMGRAATILVRWADPRRGADFLRQMLAPPPDVAALSAIAKLANRLGLPGVAVQAARLAGHDGAILAGSGWPAPVQPPEPPGAALSLGIIRQESSFDAAIVSAAGAQGLMQLRPGTAAQVARAQRLPAGPLDDPAVNLRLGTAYLASLLDQFGGVQPYAIAAYNAGPRRAREWIAANGDAAATGSTGAVAVGGTDAMVDWIELIPFAETRNYVQRVLENELDYRARRPGAG